MPTHSAAVLYSWYRKHILRWHLYAGCLCAPFLIIMGLSALNYSHRFAPLFGTTTVDWESPVALPDTSDLQVLGELTRDQLALYGYLPAWERRLDSTGVYSFKLFRPAKAYAMRLNAERTRVKIAEERGNVVQVLADIHPLIAARDMTPAITAWSWYGELCTLLSVFLAVSAAYLMGRSRRRRKQSWTVTSAVAAAALALMLYITLVG